MRINPMLRGSVGLLHYIAATLGVVAGPHGLARSAGRPASFAGIRAPRRAARLYISPRRSSFTWRDDGRRGFNSPRRDGNGHEAEAESSRRPSDRNLLVRRP